MVKHFFKVLAIFIAMIVLGLVGIVVVNSFGKDDTQTASIPNQVQVAK